VLAAVKTKPPVAVALPAVGPGLTAAARGARADPRSGRRNGAPIEQRNWLLMPCQTDHPPFGKRDSQPASLEGSRLAEKLNTIVEFDLEELQAIDLLRGYGRD
jgi:hypothetical protein